jgi:hypothetical protein
MGCRKNQATLTGPEKTAFANAVLALKQAPSQMGLANRYDDYVQMHVNSMTGGNNWAHRRPGFLPWHREYLRRFEQDLQAIDPTVNLPYWDWTVDNSPASSIWGADLMGGDGTGVNHKVETGPFAFDAGNWTINVHDPGDGGFPYLRRNFGGNGFAPTLPTATQLTNCLTETPYDEDPWDDSSTLASFRNRLEGWFGAGSIHNRVHVWVGGADGTMLFSTSPNDPVFWLHHCNIDRLWVEWLKQHPAEAYHPSGGAGDSGPAGHNLPDSMQPWGGITTVAGTLDHHALGYWYDTDEPDVNLTTPSLAFIDVPEGLGGGGVTTYRAIVFEVRSCQPVTFDIIAGPTAGFGVTPLGTSVTVPSAHGQQPAIARLWISYTSTTNGDVANGSVTVAQAGTANQWVITLSANTIARPKTAVALALDRSGSMSGDAGGVTKRDKLVEAVEIFVDTMLEGDGLSIVSFDDVVARLLDVTDVGPQPPVPGSGRAQAATILSGTDLDPRGLTAIGSAVIEAQDALADAQAVAGPPYDVQSVVVLTDGIENVPPMVNSIGASITANTFAIGIGSANNISTDALNTLTQSTGGYLLITGPLDQSQEFLLSKYFLQVLAGITNANVVIDPVGNLVFGPTHRIPFTVAPGDFGCDAILTSPLAPHIDFRLEAPDGTIIDPGVAAGIPAMAFVRRRFVSYYRTALPLGGPGRSLHAGKWTALLSLNPNTIAGVLREAQKRPDLLRALRTRSVPYNLLVHAYSTLRVTANLDRGVVRPGERIDVSVSVSEYDVPSMARAAVWMEVQGPSGALVTVGLQLGSEGIFRGSVGTYSPGVYRIRVRVRGSTLHGTQFTREQVLSAAALAVGSQPNQPDFELEQDARDERLCHLLRCLAGSANLERMGLDPAAVKKCLAEFCRRPRRTAGERAAQRRPFVSTAPPPSIARIVEGKPRITPTMAMDEHEMVGPMFGLSPQDIAEARARGVQGDPPGPKPRIAKPKKRRKP